MQGITKLLLVILMVVSVIFGIAVYQKTQKINLSPQVQDIWERPSWGEVEQHKPQEEKPQEENSPQVRNIVATDYSEALKVAGKEGMPILLFFTKDSCKYCEMMKNNTLNTSVVQHAMLPYVYCVVDISTHNGKPVRSNDYRVGAKYKIKALPTYIIVNSHEQVLKRGQGYMDTHGFALWLDNPELYNQEKIEKNNDEFQLPQDNEPEEYKPEPQKKRKGIFWKRSSNSYCK